MRLLPFLLLAACAAAGAETQDPAPAEAERGKPPDFLERAALPEGHYVEYRLTGLNPEDPAEEFEIRFANLGHPEGVKPVEVGGDTWVEARIASLRKEDPDPAILVRAHVPPERIRVTDNPFHGAKLLHVQIGEQQSLIYNESQIEERRKNPNSRLFPLITQENTLPLFLSKADYAATGEAEFSLGDRKIACRILTGRPRRGAAGEEEIAFDRLTVWESAEVPSRIVRAEGKGRVTKEGQREEFAGKVELTAFGKGAKTGFTRDPIPIPRAPGAPRQPSGGDRVLDPSVLER